jgi:hypothetical protein
LQAPLDGAMATPIWASILSHEMSKDKSSWVMEFSDKYKESLEVPSLSRPKMRLLPGPDKRKRKWTSSTQSFKAPFVITQSPSLLVVLGLAL